MAFIADGFSYFVFFTCLCKSRQYCVVNCKYAFVAFEMENGE